MSATTRTPSNIGTKPHGSTCEIQLLAPTPLLLIAGSHAETLVQSQAAYEKAYEPKELYLVDGGTHFDFYDKPEYVGPAVAKIDSFLRTHL